MGAFPAALSTDRFHLRELTEADATMRYLGWFGDVDTARFIEGTKTATDLEALRAYVRSKMGRDDVLFLGIFDKATGQHVGNIKYEPLISEVGCAMLGVLIGDTAYRGKGVASEVILASSAWLKRNRGIAQIVLGVHAENTAAISAYERIGFQVGDTPLIPRTASEQITMIWYP
jgi:[ribosomal protein S5]-alanine N-acetyltransferase